ncbi:MAG: hypothetical protein ACYCYI_03275 [Saccharofermentanales bacterium]
MDKSKKRILIGIVITLIIYIGLSAWDYFLSITDRTGWTSLGIIVFSFVFVIPIFSILCGILGQILIRKVWVFPVINTAGVLLFLSFVLIMTNDYKPTILVLVPAAFIVTLLFSFITYLLQKLLPKKNFPEDAVADLEAEAKEAEELEALKKQEEQNDAELLKEAEQAKAAEEANRKIEAEKSAEALEERKVKEASEADENKQI